MPAEDWDAHSDPHDEPDNPDDWSECDDPSREDEDE